MPGLVDALNCTSLHTLDGSNYASVDFSVGTGFSGPYRVSRFNFRPRIEGGSSPKLQTYGSWPGFLDPRDLVVDLEGRLLGSTPSDVISNRLALLAAVVVPPDYDRAIREHSRLTATFPGQSEVYLDVQLVEYDCELDVEAGLSIPYRFSWIAPFGYWRLTSNDDPVVI